MAVYPIFIQQRPYSQVSPTGVLQTVDYPEIVYFLGVEMKYADEIKEKKLNFSLVSSKKANKVNFAEYTVSIMPETFKPHFKLINEWSDLFGYLVQYRYIKTFSRTWNE